MLAGMDSMVPIQEKGIGRGDHRVMWADSLNLLLCILCNLSPGYYARADVRDLGGKHLSIKA